MNRIIDWAFDHFGYHWTILITAVIWGGFIWLMTFWWSDVALLAALLGSGVLIFVAYFCRLIMDRD